MSCAGVLCAVTCVYTFVVHLPLWIEPRFWQPAVAPLLVCAALGVTAIRRPSAPDGRSG